MNFLQGFMMGVFAFCVVAGFVVTAFAVIGVIGGIAGVARAVKHSNDGDGDDE